MGGLINASKPADVITVFEKLQSLGQDGDAGGLAYLNALAQSVPSAANLRRYAEIVRERAVLRKLIEANGWKLDRPALFNHRGLRVGEIVSEVDLEDV